LTSRARARNQQRRRLSMEIAVGPSWGREPAVTHGQQRSPADSRNRSSIAVLAGHGAAGPYMACKGSGVQIPSAPPQVNGPLRRGPTADRPPRAANQQQSVSARPIRSSGAPLTRASIVGVVHGRPRAPTGPRRPAHHRPPRHGVLHLLDADRTLLRSLPTHSAPPSSPGCATPAPPDRHRPHQPARRASIGGSTTTAP
jgi:hypothetical protein